MRVEDLLWGVDPNGVVTAPDVDPFVEDDALREAQLLELRIDGVSSTAGLLLELRTALQFEVGSFALVVVRGVRSTNWHTDFPPRARTAWSVVGGGTTRPSGLLGLGLDLWPDARCEVTGTHAEFFVFDVPGIDETPPDYASDSDANVRAGLPRWSSAVTLLQRSHAS